MIATSHFFHGIKERLHVFIPLEFKIAGTLGLCGEWPFSHTLMGPGDQ